ncbi:MAG: fluoride efflux transporter FluC [Cyclonatronaceae bacterium]
MSFRNSLGVAIGGGAGVLVRYALILLIDGSWAVPAAIILANMCGCFILGYVSAHPVLKKNAIHWLGTGFAGGLTTFSNFAFDLFWLTEAAGLSVSVLYGLTGLLSGIVAGVAGFRLPRWLHIYRLVQQRRRY